MSFYEEYNTAGCGHTHKDNRAPTRLKKESGRPFLRFLSINGQADEGDSDNSPAAGLVIAPAIAMAIVPARFTSAQVRFLEPP